MDVYLGIYTYVYNSVGSGGGLVFLVHWGLCSRDASRNQISFNRINNNFIHDKYKRKTYALLNKKIYIQYQKEKKSLRWEEDKHSLPVTTGS